MYCNNISDLFNEMGIVNYSPENWRLFIDSSKQNFKCVLLHNGNKYGSIPVAHSVEAKKAYESIKVVLELISYNEHQWNICVDDKMVYFLLGQQSGYTKYPCFLCLWDSRARQEHWVQKGWPIREEIHVGDKNITNVPLEDRKNVVFPPLQIKLCFSSNLSKPCTKKETVSSTSKLLSKAQAKKKSKQWCLMDLKLENRTRTLISFYL